MGSDRSGDFCSIDFLVEVKNVDNKTTGFLMLEVDEEQHKFISYTISCEVRRMSETFRSLLLEGNTLPVAFIRYNPHKFTRDGASITKLKRDREAELVEKIKNWEFEQPAGVYYMYYDTVDETPLIFCDPEYNEGFKEYLIGCC